MKIWTTYGVYGATGEGETVMACFAYAHDEAQATAAFIAAFGEFFGEFGTAVEGVARNRVTELLFSEAALNRIEGMQGKAKVSAHAMLHFNFA